MTNGYLLSTYPLSSDKVQRGQPGKIMRAPIRTVTNPGILLYIFIFIFVFIYISLYHKPFVPFTVHSGSE